MDSRRHQFPNDWPAPESYLTELGRMTVLWGSLEALTVAAISKLAGYEQNLDARALVLTAHMNFQQRIDVISALCEQLAEDHPRLANHEPVIKLLKAAQKQRNKFAHNGLGYDSENPEVTLTYATARGSLKLHSEIVRLADIKEVSCKIHEALLGLHELVTGVRYPPIWERT